jgi:hypothetical protein
MNLAISESLGWRGGTKEPVAPVQSGTRISSNDSVFILPSIKISTTGTTGSNAHF